MLTLGVNTKHHYKIIKMVILIVKIKKIFLKIIIKGFIKYRKIQ